MIEQIKKSVDSFDRKGYAPEDMRMNCEKWLRYLVGEVERCQGETVTKDKLMLRKIHSYERILNWYADDKNYHILDERGYKAVENDDGERARLVLRRWNEDERNTSI